MAVLVKKINANGIPTLLVCEENSMNLPVVFFVHGFTSKKEKDLNIGYELACRGMACVLIDARQHGERIPPGLDNSDEEIRAQHFFDIVSGTGDDVSGVINHYSKDVRVDIKRAGMAGLSMGGFITYYVVTKDKRIRAAAPLIATPDWEGFINANRNIVQGIDENQIRREVNEIDPMLCYKEMYPCAMLIQNGKADTLMPYQGVKKLYELLYPLYEKDQDRLKLYLYDNIGHDVIEPMRQRLYSFFSKNL